MHPQPQHPSTNTPTQQPSVEDESGEVPPPPQQQEQMQQWLEQMQSHQHQLGYIKLPSSGGPFIVNPVAGNKQWHQTITLDIRNEIVCKLVCSIIPTSNPLALLDTRMHSLVAYARDLESEMYETAETRSEYYHLLAGKIYMIHEECEKRKQSRQRQRHPE